MEHEKIFKKIAAISKKSKLPVYVVGGFVRDLFLDGVEKKDYDFVVEGSGLAFAKLLDDALKQEGSLIEFPDFDTARYVVGEGEKKVELEFAGARSETYTAHSRKPLVSETTLQKDLERRDFTVNAMAIPMSVWGTKIVPNQETLIDAVIDPFAGKKDLAAKILRTPLDPEFLQFSPPPSSSPPRLPWPVPMCGTYNRITLIEKTNERSKSGKTIYKGICDCGEVRYLVGSSVKSGHIKSCGCLKREMVCKKNKDNAYDLSGTTVGMLTVIRKTGRIKQTQHEYECLCKCGRTTYAYTSQLVKGNKKERKSCGCIQGQNFYDDLTGKKFNNVLVIGDDGTRTKNFQVLWLCQCQECGKEWPWSSLHFEDVLDPMDIWLY
jgi:hypothetical protein